MQTKKYVAYVGKVCYFSPVARPCMSESDSYFVHSVFLTIPTPSTRSKLLDDDATMKEKVLSFNCASNNLGEESVDISNDLTMITDSVPSTYKPFRWSNCTISGVCMAYARRANVKVWNEPQFVIKPKAMLDRIQRRVRRERKQWNAKPRHGTSPHSIIETKGTDISQSFDLLEFADLEGEESGKWLRHLNEKEIREAEAFVPFVRVLFDLSLAYGHSNKIEDYKIIMKS